MATWEVQGNYGYGHGWECVDASDTHEGALEALQTYRENEPGIPFRVKRVRPSEAE